jgi:hypothetical protein
MLWLSLPVAATPNAELLSRALLKLFYCVYKDPFKLSHHFAWEGWILKTGSWLNLLGSI